MTFIEGIYGGGAGSGLLWGLAALRELTSAATLDDAWDFCSLAARPNAMWANGGLLHGLHSRGTVSG